MRKTLHCGFERSNYAGNQQEDKVPAHTIQKGESSGQQHHVHVLSDVAEESEEYDWYVPAVSSITGFRMSGSDAESAPPVQFASKPFFRSRSSVNCQIVHTFSTSNAANIGSG
jgi:hypothetical protein